MNSPEGREAPVSITTLVLPSPLDEQPRGKGISSLYHYACLQSLSLHSPALWMNSPEGREAPVSITTLVLPSPLDEQPRGKGGSSLYHHPCPPQPSG
ncbi:hypothetical protein ACOMHN_020662 [Nucella lapillus]